MTTLVSFIKKHKLPSRTTLANLLTPPLSWYGVLLYVLFALAIVTTYALIINVNKTFLVAIPARGGSVTEGVLGSPRFINPILAQTETDMALSKLIYSGLFDVQTDGTATPVLASGYTVSPDGKTYTATLRPKLFWSDHKQITSADIMFTVQKLSDSTISNVAPFWQTVAAAAPDPSTIVFTLPTPDPAFLAKLSFGILPKHIWGEGATMHDFETLPTKHQLVGSGAFKVDSITSTDQSISRLYLSRNRSYPLERPYLDALTLLFFTNQEALSQALVQGSIDMTLGLTPEYAQSFSVTDYQNTPIATDTTLTIARTGADPFLNNNAIIGILNQTIDKQSITDTVVHGYGIPVGTPIGASPAHDIDTAKASIQSLGYTYRDGLLEQKGAPVGFSLAVENDPVLLKTAEAVRTEIEKLGITVVVKAFDPGTFQSETSAHTYQAILVDQTTLPGGYQSIIPLFTETYPFVSRIPNLKISPYLRNRTDRYQTAPRWYVKTDHIWPFVKNILNAINNNK